MRIVHLTDPHLTSLDRIAWSALCGKRALGYLSWLRKRRRCHRGDILATMTMAVRQEAADLIALTGDLVHLGLPQEIAAARAWLSALGMPAEIVLVPGNHDCYRNDSIAHVHDQWQAYFHFEEAAHPRFPTITRHGEIVLFGLSSAYPTPVFSAAGVVGEAQLQRLDRQLGLAHDAFRCVLIHHSPCAAGVSRRRRLIDLQNLQAVLIKHDVDLVMHGHVHRNTVSQLDGRTRILGTASASAADPRHRASYRVLDIARETGGWSVRARLKSLSLGGELRTVADETWRTP